MTLWRETLCEHGYAVEHVQDGFDSRQPPHDPPNHVCPGGTRTEVTIDYEAAKAYFRDDLADVVVAAVAAALTPPVCPTCEAGEVRIVSLWSENKDLDMGTKPCPDCHGSGVAALFTPPGEPQQLDGIAHTTGYPPGDTDD